MLIIRGLGIIKFKFEITKVSYKYNTHLIIQPLPDLFHK